MKVCSVIAEFDPFHNGHQYLLRQARKITQADVVIVLMSGNFLQRGEPAIIDKWHRTREALLGGADLVIELPIQVSVQAAKLFAQGAIQMAGQLQSETVVFGSEHPELKFAQLAQAAKQLSFKPDAYNQSYASQLFTTLETHTGVMLHSANDILAFNYFLANQELKQPLKLIPVERLEVGHSDPLCAGMHFASAAAIRQARQQQKNTYHPYVPEQTQKDLAGKAVSWQDLWPYLKYRILTSSAAELATIYGASEGIENRLKAKVEEADSFDDFLHVVKSKRYTYTRLQRLCLAVVLNLTKSQMRDPVSIFRILGFRSMGRQYLHELSRNEVPLLSRVTPQTVPMAYQTTFMADQIYQLLMGNEQNIGKKPVILP
ncbi:nucleotidyltransferase [Pediococcus siamensis]|uniref:nucleotidyltransferase n=1 Tax=Pediococcus siamensis TaxID=381829 RepID=UPI00399F207A